MGETTVWMCFCCHLSRRYCAMLGHDRTQASHSLLDTLTLKPTDIVPTCPGTPNVAAQLIRDNLGVFWYVRRLLLQPEWGYLQILSWRFSSEKLLGTWCGWSCGVNRNHNKKCGSVNKDRYPQIRFASRLKWRRRPTILLSSLLRLEGTRSWTTKHCCSMSKLHNHCPG